MLWSRGWKPEPDPLDVRRILQHKENLIKQNDCPGCSTTASIRVLVPGWSDGPSLWGACLSDCTCSLGGMLLGSPRRGCNRNSANHPDHSFEICTDSQFPVIHHNSRPGQTALQLCQTKRESPVTSLPTSTPEQSGKPPATLLYPNPTHPRDP